MDYLPDIPPDFGPQVSTRFSIDEVQFGDGYAQRRPAGLNPAQDSWPLRWSMLTRDEYERLYGFLRARFGVYAFWWQPPWETAAKRFICQELSGQQPTSARFGAINATFREDHNP